MRVVVTGSTGLVGTAVTNELRRAGHDVTRVVRSYGGVPHGERAIVWQPDRGVIEAAGLEGADVVVHLAGESVAGVWTDAKKRRIRDSRVNGTALLASTLAGLTDRPRALFSASGFNFYGDRPDGDEVDERSPAGTGFLAEVARDWETATAPAKEAGIRVVNMRFGNVLSPRGGMLPVLLPLFRVGLGAKFGDGSQYWPWIALDDIPPALLHVLERPEIAGPVNFAAPRAVTNAEFTDTLADVVGRPSFLKVPAFAARLAPGHMSDELLLGGARVLPRVLLESGYPYRSPELKPALKAMLAG
jgi:uncharacterized protein